ncbi:MAG: MotE family protein [Bacilli bacterium]
MAEKLPTEERKYGRIQWFFFVVFIPFVSAIVLSIGVLYIAGIDVVKEGKEIFAKVPFLQSMVDVESAESKEQKLTRENEQLKKQSETLKTEVEALKKDQSEKDQQLLKLQSEIDELQRQLETNAMSNEEIEAKYKSIAKSYSDMKPKQTAEILQKLTPIEAVQILKRMNKDSLTAVLENVPADQAAVYTKLLLQ